MRIGETLFGNYNKRRDMTIEEKIRVLGLELPEPPKPGGNYSSTNIRNGILYIAIQFPKWNGEFLYRGILGKDLSTEEGYKALQICALNTLSHIAGIKGIEDKIALNHLDIMYRATAGWDDVPLVADGASDLFIQVLGDRGQHTRYVSGVWHLPKNFSVGLVSSFSLL
jgi:hypothetical protein